MAGLDDLIDALEQTDSGSTVTSVRQPRALRRALVVAVEMGWASNANDGLNQALRDQLEAFAQRAALDAHYELHPHVRPALADVAVALAELDHDPLAQDPELIALAAREVVSVKAAADADDVLLWAASLKRHGIQAHRSHDALPA